MSAILYLEGGGDSKELHVRCREGFRKLLEKCGFTQQQRMPRLFACGGRAAVLDDFATAHGNNTTAKYVAMWIDSEDPIVDIEAAWGHLGNVTTVPQWTRPEGARDDQVLFMATCVETWIVTDRDALRDYYGNNLQESALPPLFELEARDRHDVQQRLIHATRDCKNAYAKGKRSYEILGKLSPTTLDENLPSFARVRRILNENL